VPENVGTGMNKQQKKFVCALAQREVKWHNIFKGGDFLVLFRGN